MARNQPIVAYNPVCLDGWGLAEKTAFSLSLPQMGKKEQQRRRANGTQFEAICNHHAAAEGGEDKYVCAKDGSWLLGVGLNGPVFVWK